jgi:hypothetical protein
MVLGDERRQDFAPALLEDRQGPGLIRLHEAAVANHISGQNGGKATLNAFFGHPRNCFQRGHCGK